MGNANILVQGTTWNTVVQLSHSSFTAPSFGLMLCIEKWDGI